MDDQTVMPVHGRSVDDLLSSLQHLDRLLERAIFAARDTYGTEAETDPYRGLYIDRQDVERMLAGQPGVSALNIESTQLDPVSGRISNAKPLLWLEQTCGLSPFDTNLVLIALAPELDLRYERIYAFLQDDVTRKRPTVDLALTLLCTSASDRIARRAHLTPSAPLLQQGLISLVADPNQVQPSFLAHFLKLDEQVIRLLLDQSELDPRLRSFCQSDRPSASLEHSVLDPGTREALNRLAAQSWQSRQPLKLCFCGPAGTGKRRTAEAIAAHLGAPLISSNLSQALDLKLELETALPILFREARWQNAVLYLTGLDALAGQEQTLARQLLMAQLADHPGMIVLANQQPKLQIQFHTANTVEINFSIPNFSQRRTFWQASLNQNSITISTKQLEALANCFRLTPEQIERTIIAAQNHVHWQRAIQATEKPPLAQPSFPAITIKDLFMAARAQSSQDLSLLARKIETRYTWNEIILPPDQLDQLREICSQVKNRYVVYSEWGFERRLSLGRGLNVLFSGPPGTGKTMAAEVIASELQLDLYKIDLSQVVSKYIGETEKNLDRIFNAAQNANAILFFDEADALFGKRSEVKDAHDRYANIEIGYLLQKMEEYEGLAILATNLRQNMDDAFVRRLQIIIDFPFPDEEHRRQIWQVVFPPEAPLEKDIDFELLAREIRLAGANIKNIGLAAAFYAANEEQAIKMTHLIQAARREHQKLGRTWNELER